MIVKAGYITDKLCARLFADTMRSRRLALVMEFENKEKLFKGVHPQERFALITLGSEVKSTRFSFDNLSIVDAVDAAKHIVMPSHVIELVAPNTGNCPKFSNQLEFSITQRCHELCHVLVRKDPRINEWDISIDRYINVSDFSEDIFFASELEEPDSTFSVNHEIVPLHEGKLFHQYDHRFATYKYRSASNDYFEVADKGPNVHQCFYRYIPTSIALRKNEMLSQIDHVLVFRDITNRTNERGLIACILPAHITDYTVRVIRTGGNSTSSSLLLSILNSFLCDFIARQRIGGTHLSNYILEQLPIFPPHTYTPALIDFIGPRVLELTYTAWDMGDFARDLGYDGAPFVWDEERRFLMRCELDALYFHLYGIERDDVDYIMETFPIVKKKDVKGHCEYRTKRVILEMYDLMADVPTMQVPAPKPEHGEMAVPDVSQWVTPLDPPPADPRAAHEVE